MNRVKIAVIGVGSLGQHHARILSSMEGAELAGVVDAREEQGLSVASRHGTRWYADANELIGLVDGVVIAVPTVLHHRIAMPFLEAGTAVLIEKPIAETLESAMALHRVSRFRKAILQVGHVERFNPAFELLREQIHEPRYLRCQRLSPYSFRSTDIGVVHDLMIHDIDLVLSLMNPDDTVIAADSFGGVAVGPHEDMVVARLRFSSGAVADLTASRMNPTAERSLQVWGRTGCISADLHQRTVSTWKPSPDVAARPSMIHDVIAATPNPLTLKDTVFTNWITHQTQQASAADALTAELSDFVTCIRTGGTPRVTGADAVRAMEVADMVLKSLSVWSWQTPDAAGERKAA